MNEEIDLSKNTEINNALKEFEIKNTNQTTQVSSSAKDSGIPKMDQWIMKFSCGLIKEQKQAEYVLLFFAILAILISLFLFFGGKKIRKVETRYVPIEQR